MGSLKKLFSPFTLALVLAVVSTSVHAIPLIATVTGGSALLSYANRMVLDTNEVPDSRQGTAMPFISQFNSNYGVLVGVTATLTPGSSSTYLRADNFYNQNASGTARVSATWNGISGLNTSGLLNSATRDSSPNSTDGTSNTWSSISQTINDGADLNSWVGTGSLFSFVKTTLTADRDSGFFIARIGSSGDNNVETLTNLTSSYNVTYDYLNHAAASFDDGSSMTELTLDFGERNLGEVASIGFGLFNLTGDRVGLDLDFISGNGDTSVLTTDLIPFTSLAAGNHLDFLASFDTSNLGSFAATYVLDLSDENVGAPDSRYNFNDYLTLHVSGTVIEGSVLAAANAIPEPDMLALVAIGLLGFLGIRRQ